MKSSGMQVLMRLDFETHGNLKRQETHIYMCEKKAGP